MNAAEVGRTVTEWQAAGRTCGFARVGEIRGIGSAGPGELLVWNDAGDTAGELLGGALDAPVREAARRVLADPAGSVEVLDLSIDDSGARQAGLSCGGAATVVVQAAAQVPGEFWSALAGYRPVALATAVGGQGSLVALGGGGTYGSFGAPDDDSIVEDAVRRLLAGGETISSRVEVGERTVLTWAFVPEPALVVVGEGAIADAIAHQAATLGWQATVTGDADTATAALAAAGASAALVVLTHAVKLDVPVLAAALRAGVPYVGALGSARTQQRRAERLRNLGFAETDIEAVHGPIGLDLGGNRPSYIALAICAEILASRNHRDPASLRGRTAPIRPVRAPVRH